MNSLFSDKRSLQKGAFYTSGLFEVKDRYNAQDLVRLMELLRSDKGCPWDREQDHMSIRKNFLEETYEVLEAIDAKDAEMLKEELGDVLLQVVFHARISEENEEFDFDGVCDGICKKLVERHPHIFAKISVSGTGEVLRNWDKIKEKSKGQKTYTETLRSVPTVLPALMRSDKVQSRAAKSGFDYPDTACAIVQLKDEIAELEEAIVEGESAHIEEELGDLLFSVVNVARFVKADAEQSLAKSCEKFITRFEVVERLAVERGITMKEQSIDALDQLWKEAKAILK